jgi:hypothetical protein
MTAPLSLRLAAVVVGLVTAVACNSSNSPAMPDAAQPSPASPGSSTSGATISGLVSNGGSATGALMLMAAGGMSGVTVTVPGAGRTATTDGTGRFSLTGVPAGQVTLQFTGAATGSMSLDDVAEHDTIRIEVHVQNGQIQDEQAQTGAQAQLEGKIVSVNGGGHSFVIGQITVMVPSTATIRHGDQTLAFSDLIAGARVHVKGSLTGSTLTATRVEVQQSGGPGPGNGNGNGGNGNGNGGTGNGGNDDNDANEVELTGSVASLGGACPAVTFTTGGRSVATTSNTRFDLACASIANGTKVEVKGTSPTPSGVVTATRVKKEN